MWLLVSDADLNILSKGNLCASSSTMSVENTLGELEMGIVAVEVADDGELDGDASWLLGRNTITVFPTVVRNSSKPKTVLVSIPEKYFSIKNICQC